ncbi:ribosomal protein L11 methyltransferase [Lachnospiraceae bacterium NE2001]|nr:ribosomal protein L11 methyltransferase [Lachnospiraceae bacterium NE2001]
MIWTKFTIETTTEVVDLLSDFLSDKGIEGIQIEDNVPLTEDEIKQMFVDIPLQLGEDDGTAKISCFLDDSFSTTKIEELKADVKAELERLSEFLPVGTGVISVEDTTDDSTWNDKFMENFKPTRLYDNIVIMPVIDEESDVYDTLKAYKNLDGFELREDDKVIRIETVTAFGTGTHETTRLCLGAVKSALQSNVNKEMSVFDIGCGSGILSIAACLMGAGYVHGLDIDPQAVKASVINAKASGLSKDRIEFSCGNLLADNRIAENFLSQDDNREKMEKASLGSGIASPINPDDAARIVDIGLGDSDPIPARKYNIVVANILADVIIPLATIVRDYMTEDGVFISSGISEGKADSVRDALVQNGFDIIDETRENEWVCFTAK